MKVKDLYARYIPFKATDDTPNITLMINPVYAMELFLYAKYDPFKLVDIKDPLYKWYNQQHLIHEYVDLEKIMKKMISYSSNREDNSFGKFFNENHSLKDLYNILITDRNKFSEITKSIDVTTIIKSDNELDKDIQNLSDDKLYDWYTSGSVRELMFKVSSEASNFWTGIYFVIYKHMVNGLLRSTADYTKTHGSIERLLNGKELNINMKINRVYNKIIDNYKVNYNISKDKIDKSLITPVELKNGKTIQTYYSSTYNNTKLTEVCQNVDNIMKKVLDKTITLRFIINGRAYNAEVEQAKIYPEDYTYLKNPTPLYAYYKKQHSDFGSIFYNYLNKDGYIVRPVYKVTKLTDMDGVEQPINLKDAYGIYKVYDAPYNVMDMNDPTKNVVKVSDPNIDRRLYKEDILDYTLTDYQTIYDDIFDNKDPNLNMNYYQGRHITIESVDEYKRSNNDFYDFITYNIAPQFLSNEIILKNVNTQKVTYKNSLLKMFYDPLFEENKGYNYHDAYMSKLKPFEPVSTNVGQYLDHDFSLNMFDLTPFLSNIQIDMINNSLKKLDKLVIPILCKKNPMYRVEYDNIVDNTVLEQDYFLNRIKKYYDDTNQYYSKEDSKNEIDMDISELNKKVQYMTPNTIRDFDNYIDRISQLKDDKITFSPYILNYKTKLSSTQIKNIIDNNKDKDNMHMIGNLNMEDYSDNLFFFDLCAQYAIHNNIRKEDDEKDDVISKLLSLMPSKLAPHFVLFDESMENYVNDGNLYGKIGKWIIDSGIDENYKTPLEYIDKWISNGGGVNDSSDPQPHPEKCRVDFINKCDDGSPFPPNDFVKDGYVYLDTGTYNFGSPKVTYLDIENYKYSFTGADPRSVTLSKPGQHKIVTYYWKRTKKPEVIDPIPPRPEPTPDPDVKPTPTPEPEPVPEPENPYAICKLTLVITCDDDVIPDKEIEITVKKGTVVKSNQAALDKIFDVYEIIRTEYEGYKPYKMSFSRRGDDFADDFNGHIEDLVINEDTVIYIRLRW